MSKRRKPTIADRYYEMEAKIGESMLEAIELMARMKSPYALFSLESGEAYSRLEMLGLWKECRHVFRFDRDVTEALDATDTPDDMPAEELARLPYDIIFIEAPYTVRSTAEGNYNVAGAFVWRSVSDGDACVKMSYVTPNLTRSIAITVPIAGRTLGEAANEVTTSMLHDVEEVRRRSGMTYEVAEEPSKMLLGFLAHVANHILYLNSREFDDEVVYEPSGKLSPKRARIQSQSVIHATGVRMGRLIREERKSHLCGQAAATGKHVRPHVRRGHYHRYWTGRKDHPEERKPVIHWIRPTYVNAGKGDPIRDTYLHVSPRKPRS